MRGNRKIIVSVLLIATLIFTFSSICYAETGTDIINSITSNMYLKKHVDKADGVVIGVKYAIEIPKSALKNATVKDGQIMIDNGDGTVTPYSLEVRVGDRTISLGSSLVYDEEEGLYYHHISTLGVEDELSSLSVSLVPSDYSSPAEPYNPTVTPNRSKLEINPDDKGRVVTEVNPTSLLEVFWGVLTGDIDEVANYLTEAFCGMLIPLGDSFLHMISIAVGEPVTIDKVVYNDVTKLDVNLFEISEDYPYQKPLKNIMSGVVNSWYDVFRGITIVALMIMLVYIGIKILLVSTAEKNAVYKSVFSAWVMAVVMLMFFPYVMKYIILLNNGFCTWMGEQASKFYATGSDEVDEVKPMGSISGMSGAYGKDEFIMLVLGETGSAKDFAKNAVEKNLFGSNIMMRIRFIGAKKLDVPLIVIYLILIGQLLSILILYYKRVFMIAFLITIYPLVIILYPLKKIGDIKTDAFGTWFKEFIVNVVVQAFHAITYTVVVLIGVNSYLQSDNWLFMMLCVLFLFEGEKVVRSIFGITSSAKSIGDLAMSGAMTAAALKKVGGFFPSGSKNEKKNEKDPKDVAIKDRRNSIATATRSAQNARAEAQAAGSGTPINVADVKGGLDIETDRTTYAPHYYTPVSDFSNVGKIVDEYEEGIKKKLGNKFLNATGGIVGKATDYATRTAFTTLGATYGLATMDSKNGIDKAIGTGMAGYGVGKTLGEGASNTIKGIVSRGTRVVAANHVANEYLDGQHDDEIGVTEAMAEADKARANALREVYARAAKHSGSKKAEIKFIKDSIEAREK